MISIIGAYVLSLVVLLVVDLSWAGFVMKSFYQTRLSYIISPTVNWPPVIFFYLFLSVAIFYLAAYQAYMRGSLLAAIGAGVLLGIAAYGTYDFTNMATLPNWPLSVTVVDVLWGGAVCAITAAAGYYFLKLFN